MKKCQMSSFAKGEVLRRQSLKCQILLGLGFSLALLLPTKVFAQALPYFSDQDFWKMLLVVSGAALGDSINPCAIITLLLFLIFMFTLKKSKRTIFFLGSLYILGIFLVYYLIGLGLLKTYLLFGTPHLIAKIMALVAFLIGLTTIYEFFSGRRLKFFSISPNARLIFMNWARRGTAAAAFGLGILVGLFEFPCTGGIYLAITGLLSAKTDYLTAVFWLLFYNLVFILPLLLILVFSSRPLLADRILAWQESKSSVSRLIAGIIMLILAVAIWFLAS